MFSSVLVIAYTSANLPAINNTFVTNTVNVLLSKYRSEIEKPLNTLFAKNKTNVI